MSHEGRNPPGKAGTAASPLGAGPASVLSGTAVLDLLSSGIGLVAPDGTIIFVNRAWTSLLGMSADECIGKDLLTVLPQVDQVADYESPAATLVDGVPRKTHISSGRGTYEIQATRNAFGMLVLEVRDRSPVTRLEQQHDRLLERVTDGLCVFDARWHFSYWNAAAERMTGVPRQELLGKPMRSAFTNLLNTPVGEALRETIMSHRARHIQRWQYDGDDRGRAAGVYDVFSYPVEGGGLLVIFREVSDRVTQELELADRSAEADALRRLARAMAEENDFDALLRLLCEDALRHCDAERSAVVRIHPREGEVVATAGSANVLRGTRFPLEGSLTAKAISQRAMVSESVDASRFPEHRHIGALQQAGPVLITPLIAHDQMLGVLTVSRSAGAPDFSARDRARLQAIADHVSLGLWKLQLLDEAQAASQAKRDFMATMSHELLTPLTALTGYGELLAEEIVGPLTSHQADVVDRMRSVSHHLAVVIDEILTFSNLEAGRETARFIDVEVPVLVRSVLAIVEPQARQRGFSFMVDVPESLRIVSDPDKMRQILVNLLGNAIKFTDAGHVALFVSKTEDRVDFRVEDSGIGIRAGDRSRLFQAFTQLESGLTRRHGGTGLGLYISQRLAALLGGWIDVESEFGRGSTFTFSLPIRPSERA